MKEKNFTILFLAFCGLILLASLRGLGGVPQTEELNSPQWKEDGPFELSPERGRFALIYSLIENQSFEFSQALGYFAEPDVAILNGRLVSLFPPGLSFVVIPGYLLGKALGASVLGPVAVVALFALANAWLIRAIAIKMGADSYLAAFAALAFLFGTPAFTYSVTLYQHHLSLFLLLLSLFILKHTKGLLADGLVWFLLGFAFVVDYPNALLALPIVLTLIKRLFVVINEGKVILINFNFLKVIASFSLILPLLFLFWFNQKSYGDPFRLSGTIERVVNLESSQGLSGTNEGTQIDATLNSYQEKKEREAKKSVWGFFNSRDMLNGLYIHLFSPDRGTVSYCPVILFGLLGAFIAYQKKLLDIGLLIGIAVLDLVTYSLWGDPWGGWAFGSRYLIPAYAILAIFFAIFLSTLKKRPVFYLLVFVPFFYSVSVNTLGAITSSKNPPQVEVLALEAITKKEEKYTFMRNLDYLDSKGSKSFVFQTLFKNYLSPNLFYQLLVFSIITFGATTLVYSQLLKKDASV